MSRTLEQQVPITLAQFGMVSPGDIIVVAVSGGPDSLSMLHLLNALKNDLGVSLHVAHLDHQFRGAESAEDARFVEEFCRSLGIPAIIRSFDVPAYLKATGKSAQEGARDIRHAFLNEQADRLGATRIAIAHTADDQVETVILNMLRGSGSDGLRGMLPVRGRIIRPLFECWRADVVDYCRRHGLTPRLDSSNLKPTYRRNKIRQSLIPMLETEFAPDIRHLLVRMAELMREDSEYLTAKAEVALASIAVASAEGYLEIERQGLVELDLPILRRVIREGIRRVKGDLTQISLEVVDEIRAGVEGDGIFKINLPGNLFAEGRQGRLVFYRPLEPQSVPLIQQELIIPGVTAVPELEIAIDAHVAPYIEGTQLNLGPWTANLDWDHVKPPFIIRNRRPGDRFTPLGMRGSRKLQDYFVDRKVPRSERDKIALIADQDEIIWIPGFNIAQRARIGDATRNILHLNAVRGARLPDAP